MTLNRTEDCFLFPSQDSFVGCEVLHNGSSGRYRCECSDVIKSGCILRQRSCTGARKEVQIDGLKRRHLSVMRCSGGWGGWFCQELEEHQEGNKLWITSVAVSETTRGLVYILMAYNTCITLLRASTALHSSVCVYELILIYHVDDMGHTHDDNHYQCFVYRYPLRTGINNSTRPTRGA